MKRKWLIRGPVVAHLFGVNEAAQLAAGPLCGAQVNEFHGDDGLTATQADLGPPVIERCQACREQANGRKP